MADASHPHIVHYIFISHLICHHMSDNITICQYMSHICHIICHHMSPTHTPIFMSHLREQLAKETGLSMRVIQVRLISDISISDISVSDISISVLRCPLSISDISYQTSRVSVLIRKLLQSVVPVHHQLMCSNIFISVRVSDSAMYKNRCEWQRPVLVSTENKKTKNKKKKKII